MSEHRTNCATCGSQIRQRTADRRDGMCVPCYRNACKPPEVLFQEAVFDRIDETIEPFTTYRKALDELRALPLGYAMCFSFHHVHADIFNGGISQLYSNSTWALILDAAAAAESAGVHEASRVLREIVYYYHKKGRSKLKRRIDNDYFADVQDDWDK